VLHARSHSKARFPLVTQLLRAGVHPKVVSERAGHSSVAFTLQRYAHALPDMQQDAADQTQKLVGSLLSK
jgi:integrase